jgi:hypothetical protein
LPFGEQGSRNKGPARLPLDERLNDTARNHFVACPGELIGTFLFLLLALSGAQVAITVRVKRGSALSTSLRQLLFWLLARCKCLSVVSCVRRSLQPSCDSCNVSGWRAALGALSPLDRCTGPWCFDRGCCGSSSVLRQTKSIDSCESRDICGRGFLDRDVPDISA